MSQIGLERGFRVLVVDPDGVSRVLLDEVLGDCGFDVLSASTDVTAYEALDREARAFNALVVDTDLRAGTTGFDVARYARRLHGTIAVIFITSARHDSTEKFGVPGAAHVARPFDPDLLIMILRALAAERE
ncbi:response regulator [Phenylobacterium sp.]|uniref:response regulator n=1 Tax=Phenylobacterium sp. TaxID=1871053 RepID=UPI003BA9E7AB